MLLGKLSFFFFHEIIPASPGTGIWQFLFNVGGSVYRPFGRKIILLKHTAQLNIKAAANQKNRVSMGFFPAIPIEIVKQ
jgi:hypothetical protein